MSSAERRVDALHRPVSETQATTHERNAAHRLTGSAGGSPAFGRLVSRPYSFVAMILAGLIAILPSFAVDQKRTPSIVSLAPSNTELILDCGAEKSLVGISKNCNQVIPNTAERLKGMPIAGSFVAANLERLTRVKPDVVLLVSGQEAIEALLKHRGFKVTVLHNDKLADIPGNLRKIGELAGRQKRADLLADNFAERLGVLKILLKDAPKKPKVFYCTWAQPLLTIGKNTFLNDVVTTCGGTNIAGTLPQAYPHFSAERLLIADPDVIILPYDAKKEELLKRFPWNKLRAVKEKRVFYSPAPKDDMLSRPTMGVLEGLYWLTAKIHPEVTPMLEKWRAKIYPRASKPLSIQGQDYSPDQLH